MEFYRTWIIEMYIGKNVIHIRTYLHTLDDRRDEEMRGKGRGGTTRTTGRKISRNDLENHDDFYVRLQHDRRRVNR